MSPSDSGEITEETRLPLRLVIGLVAVAISCALSAGGAHYYWAGRVAAIEATVAEAAKEREEATAERAQLAEALADVAEEVRGLRDEIRELADGLDRRLERIEERSGDRWTYTDMRLWAERLQRHNPTLTVPPPDSVRPR